MDLANARTQIRAVIFSIAGIIIAIIFFRISFEILGASRSGIVAELVYGLSDWFINPFVGTVQLPETSSFRILNIDAIVAMGVYMLGAIALSEILTAFLYDKFEEIIQNFVDGIFKVIEFLLFLRIVFDLFGVVIRESIPDFVRSIYSLTEWAQGILFPIQIGAMKINVSTIIVLVIVVVFDLLCERFIASIFKNFNQGVSVVTTTVKEVKVPAPKINIHLPKISRKEPPPPNITINIPVPPPQGFVQVPQQSQQNGFIQNGQKKS